jgi:hypothetical protein
MNGKWYYYEVVSPIKDYEYNLEIGDLVDWITMVKLPAYYRFNCVKNLNQPIWK